MPTHIRPKLLVRYEPTKGRAQALEEVHEKLANATELYEHIGDGGRYGVFSALTAVFEYFVSIGIPPAALEPLSAVSAAIVDAERGTSSAIFEPNRGKGGAPPTGAQQLAFEGLLAVVSECCINHLKSQGHRPFLGPGAQLAAKLVNESDWPLEVTATQMREIRERVRQCKNPLSPDRQQFDTQLSSVIAKNFPLDWIKILLKHDLVIVPPKKDSG